MRQKNDKLKMLEKAEKHLASIITSFILKHGVGFRSHYKEIPDYWDGPLSENFYLFGRHSLERFDKNKISTILSKMTDFDIHPIYTRDFFEGIIDSSCLRCFSRHFPRIEFTMFGRDGLKEFMESGEHGFLIPFEDKHNNIYTHRTKSLPFLHLPLRGEFDLYFAGALTASVIENRDGQVVLKMKNKCSKNFKTLGVIFEEKGKHIYVSPFYFMLFSGEIPGDIYFNKLKEINSVTGTKLKYACVDAMIHWKYMNCRKDWDRNDLPFLRTKGYCYDVLDANQTYLEEYTKKRNFDNFIDKRLVKRCERWYSINGKVLDFHRVIEKQRSQP